ncbi:hypothetical protein KR222_007968 [Zaprionus bogoriensis]|nr:hypothetical protein KR222_007968 [Zaprionus bogoriensis]
MALRKRKSDWVEEQPEQQEDVKRLRLDHCNKVELLDLPLLPLHLIMSKLSPRSRGLLRFASKQFGKEHMDLMLHYYKKISHNFRCQRLSCSKLLFFFTPSQVLADACNFFISSGYELAFADNLVTFQHQLKIDTMDKASGELMHKFLHIFYHTLECSAVPTTNISVAHIRFRRRRLLYTLTMLNLLRQFRQFRIISSGMNLMHWQLHIEVCGVFMFGNHQSDSVDVEEDKVVDFVALIAELLVYDKVGLNTSRFTEIGSSFYSYGLKFQPAKRSARLDLKFSILAPLTLRKLLEDVLDGQWDPNVAVTFPLFDAFSIHLEVKSTCTGYRCSDGSGRQMQITILPLI